MVQMIKDPGKIARWIDIKQANEQELAKRLYLVFDKGQAIKKLRSVVHRAVTTMMQGPEPSLNASLAKESRLLVLQPGKTGGFGATRRGLEHLAMQPGRWTANDCAELIRLVGDWIERGALNAPGDKTADAVKSEFRPKRGPEGVDIAWSEPFRDRHKYFDKPKTVEQRVPSMMRPAFSGVKNAGSFILQAKDSSNVAKMDKLFGLFNAADISGTTSDTVAVLTQWGWDLLETGYYLLPVAVFHYNLHHTILEAGLALSLNKLIDYRIGFYTTLGKGLLFPDEIKVIDRYLRSAEDDVRNRFFLVWYENRVPAGCLLFNNEERKLFKERWPLTRASQLLLRCPRLPEFPTAASVTRLVDELAPQLVPSLPREMQPEKVRF